MQRLEQYNLQKKIVAEIVEEFCVPMLTPWQGRQLPLFILAMRAQRIWELRICGGDWHAPLGWSTSSTSNVCASGRRIKGNLYS